MPQIDRKDNPAAGRRQPGLWRDVLRYATCGLAAGGTDYLTYLALTWGADWNAVAAQAVARPAGGLVSFLANRFYTFRHRQGAALPVQFARFWVVWAVSYGLALAAIAGYDALFHGRRVPAKICADATVVIVTFLLQRHWTFAERKVPGSRFTVHG